MVVLIAMTGLFAEKNVQKKGDALPPPPANVELPDPAVVKAYHEARAKALEEMLDAKVKAGIITREWADAKMDLLKAVQADCKGQCILYGMADGPFDGMGPGAGMGPRGDWEYNRRYRWDRDWDYGRWGWGHGWGYHRRYWHH